MQKNDIRDVLCTYTQVQYSSFNMCRNVGLLCSCFLCRIYIFDSKKLLKWIWKILLFFLLRLVSESNGVRQTERERDEKKCILARLHFHPHKNNCCCCCLSIGIRCYIVFKVFFTASSHGHMFWCMVWSALSLFIYWRGKKKKITKKKRE